MERFNESVSSTFKNLTDKFLIEYGDETWAAGYLVQDTVSIGGLAIKNQVFADVTFQSKLFFAVQSHSVNINTLKSIH